ncbi:MAG: hypothetical protein ABIP55_03565 [Tepidisphaeraceae bacterium]
MPDANAILEQQFLEMRWRALSLAADLDRIERAEGGRALLAADPRLANLREALKILLLNEPERAAPNRAERVQMIFSDMTPPPPR